MRGLGILEILGSMAKAPAGEVKPKAMLQIHPNTTAFTQVLLITLATPRLNHTNSSQMRCQATIGSAAAVIGLPITK